MSDFYKTLKCSNQSSAYGGVEEHVALLAADVDFDVVFASSCHVRAQDWQKSWKVRSLDGKESSFRRTDSLKAYSEIRDTLKASFSEQ